MSRGAYWPPYSAQGPVAQWIERQASNLRAEVRFLPGPLTCVLDRARCRRTRAHTARAPTRESARRAPASLRSPTSRRVAQWEPRSSRRSRLTSARRPCRHLARARRREQRLLPAGAGRRPLQAERANALGRPRAGSRPASRDRRYRGDTRKGARNVAAAQVRSTNVRAQRRSPGHRAGREVDHLPEGADRPAWEALLDVAHQSTYDPLEAVPRRQAVDHDRRQRLIRVGESEQPSFLERLSPQPRRASRSAKRLHAQGSRSRPRAHHDRSPPPGRHRPLRELADVSIHVSAVIRRCRGPQELRPGGVHDLTDCSPSLPG